MRVREQPADRRRARRIARMTGSALRLRSRLQQLAEFLDAQSGIANDPAEREGVDGVVSRNGKNACAV